MASLTIRNLDPCTKTRLRVRAARRHRSMEAEARAILQEALAEREAEPEDLGTAIRKRFESVGGVELELPERNAIRNPPGWHRSRR